MSEAPQIKIPFNVYSASAVSFARRYVTLVTAQILQAYAAERNNALQEYSGLSDPDQADYDVVVTSVDRSYEEEFIPILYFTSLVHLFTVFEIYVSKHIVEIQRLINSDLEILKQLKKKSSFVEATKKYFKDYAKITFFDESQWVQLKEIAHVRNCIVHEAGIPRDSSKNRKSIYDIENRIWRGELVGLQIDRYEGRDLGYPMILNQRFLQYCLHVIEEFFQALGTAVEEQILERESENE